MNDRNVEALERTLRDAMQAWWEEWRQPLDWSSDMLMRSFARYVAARGVLAPPALTSGESFDVTTYGNRLPTPSTVFMSHETKCQRCDRWVEDSEYYRDHAGHD